MSASIEQFERLISAAIDRQYGPEFSPSPARGVLDFVVDGRYFRILILDEAQDIEFIEVGRERDTTVEEVAEIRGLTATEAALYQEAQERAHTPTQEELVDVEESYKDQSNFGPAQAAEFEGYASAEQIEEAEDDVYDLGGEA